MKPSKCAWNAAGRFCRIQSGSSKRSLSATKHHVAATDVCMVRDLGSRQPRPRQTAGALGRAVQTMGKVIAWSQSFGLGREVSTIAGELGNVGPRTSCKVELLNASQDCA
jgi:hypothetical protein